MFRHGSCSCMLSMPLARRVHPGFLLPARREPSKAAGHESAAPHPDAAGRRPHYLLLRMKDAIQEAAGTTAALPLPTAHVPIFEKQLAEKQPHESDFHLFANFPDRDTVFLDVGANIGNSALSVHFVRPGWRVVSFEPN